MLKTYHQTFLVIVKVSNNFLNTQISEFKKKIKTTTKILLTKLQKHYLSLLVGFLMHMNTY